MKYKRIVDGYKANGYNATYDKTKFEVRWDEYEDGSRVLEVTEIFSGITYMLALNPDKKSPCKV